jgi:hypothetical protein
MPFPPGVIDSRLTGSVSLWVDWEWDSTGEKGGASSSIGTQNLGEKFEQFTPGPSREELNHMLNLPQ